MSLENRLNQVFAGPTNLQEIREKLKFFEDKMEDFRQVLKDSEAGIAARDRARKNLRAYTQSHDKLSKQFEKLNEQLRKRGTITDKGKLPKGLGKGKSPNTIKDLGPKAHPSPKHAMHNEDHVKNRINEFTNGGPGVGDPHKLFKTFKKDWFDSLSPGQKTAYLKMHPESKYAKGKSGGAAKPAPKKQKMRQRKAPNDTWGNKKT